MLTPDRYGAWLDPDNRDAGDLHRELRDLLHRGTVRPRVEALWREADEEAGARRFERAVELLTTALRLDSGNTEARSRLERMCERLEQSRRSAQLVAEARQLLDRQALADAGAKAAEALERDPQDPGALESALERAAQMPSPNPAARRAAADHDVRRMAARIADVLEGAVSRPG
jgi:hypothetical protein